MGVGVTNLRGPWILAASVLSCSRRQHRYYLDHPETARGTCRSIAWFFSAGPTSTPTSSTSKQNHRHQVFSGSFKPYSGRVKLSDGQRRGFQEIPVRSVGTLVRGGSVC